MVLTSRLIEELALAAYEPCSVGERMCIELANFRRSKNLDYCEVWLSECVSEEQIMELLSELEIHAVVVAALKRCGNGAEVKVTIEALNLKYPPADVERLIAEYRLTEELERKSETICPMPLFSR
jgi:hypothetical protein